MPPFEIREQRQKRTRALGHEHRPVPARNDPRPDVLLSSRHEKNEWDVRDEHMQASLLEEVHPQHTPVLALVRPLQVVRDDERQAVAELTEQTECVMRALGAIGIPVICSRCVEKLLARVRILKEEEY